MNNKKSLAAAVLAAAALLGAGAAQADVLFGFDSDDQGWTTSNGADLTYRSTGGNSGGYVELADSTSDDYRINAPVSALGNWSAYLNGTLSFDAKNINGDLPDYNGFGRVTLTGSTGTLDIDMVPSVGSPAIGAGWQTFSIDLSTAVWGNNLIDILNNVTSLAITNEFHVGVSEVGGFDNFRLTAANNSVPEPSGLALIGLGLIGALAARRRSR